MAKKSSVFNGTAKVHTHLETIQQSLADSGLVIIDIKNITQDVLDYLNNLLFCNELTLGATTAGWADRLACEGKAFLFADYKPYANGQVIDWIFDATNYTGDYIYLIAPTFSATGGPVFIDFYVNSEYTGGTQQVVTNRKSDGPAAQSQVWFDVTITTLGPKVAGRLIPAGGSSPATAIPAESTSQLLSIFEKTIVQHLRITNGHNGAIYQQGDFTWFEV